MSDAGVTNLIIEKENAASPSIDNKNFNLNDTDQKNMSNQLEELRRQIKEYEDRMTAFQSDIFSKTAENRRLQNQIKDLEMK